MENDSGYQRLGRHDACMLGDARGCEAKDCAGCGWTRKEIERRRRLPFWRDGMTGLQRKYVGQTKTQQ